jgi:hypothetical protein
MHSRFFTKNILVLSLLLGLSLASASAVASPQQASPDASVGASPDYTIITAEGLEQPVERLEENLKWVLPEATGRKIDLEEPEAQKIIKELDIKALPFVYFKEGFEGEKGFFDLAKRGMIGRKGKFFILTDEAARAFGSLLLDAEKDPGHLEVYTMSLCPYGQQALKQLIGRVRNEGLKISLKVRYITKFRKYGIDSLHGDDEIDENIKQLIIQKYYPDKFFDYLLARQGSTFEKAAKKSSLDEKSVSDKQAEGRKLLEDDAERAKTLGIASSPTFLFEGRYIYFGLENIPLAKAGGSKDTAKVGSAKNVEVVLFYNPTCRECRKVKNELLPEMNRKYGSSITISYYDTSQPEAYKKMIEFELKHGVLQKGKIPQVYLYPGDHALIGETAIEQDLDGLVKKIIQGGK